MLNAIVSEIELRAGYLNDKLIETIYFGGGTPSLLSADEINRIIDKVSKHFNLSSLQELTLETNPDDLTSSYIKSLRSTAVNRFSIGTQSFFDSDLQYMNRAHNAQEADYAIKAAQDAGYNNITIDLIYGTPGLSDANWQYNLAKIKKLSIPHFSSYALTVEEGTALHHNIKTKKSAPVDAEQAAGQFELLMAFAVDAGFEHYEISNLAKKGHRAVHNTNYWTGVPYLGIGPSAHSYDGQNREWNIANNANYLKGILKDKKTPIEREVLTSTQRLNEYIMTSLRTIWGLDLERVEQLWGEEYAVEITKNNMQFWEQQKTVLEDQKITLTNKGKLFADHIASELFFD